MNFGEMESKNLNLAWNLGLHPSALACLSDGSLVMVLVVYQNGVL
jgi:hypothetical protein